MLVGSREANSSTTATSEGWCTVCGEVLHARSWSTWGWTNQVTRMVYCFPIVFGFSFWYLTTYVAEIGAFVARGLWFTRCSHDLHRVGFQTTTITYTNRPASIQFGTMLHSSSSVHCHALCPSVDRLTSDAMKMLTYPKVHSACLFFSERSISETALERSPGSSEEKYMHPKRRRVSICFQNSVTFCESSLYMNRRTNFCLWPFSRAIVAQIELSSDWVGACSNAGDRSSLTDVERYKNLYIHQVRHRCAWSARCRKPYTRLPAIGCFWFPQWGQSYQLGPGCHSAG